MENKQNVHFRLAPIDYSIPYGQQPECKRHVIGAYANLARHNMTLAVNTIMEAIGMNTYDEDEIAEAFGPGHRNKLAKLDNIQKVRLQQRLYRYFTFLKRMKLEGDPNKNEEEEKEDEKKDEKKSVQLQTLLEVMADFTQCMSDIRNFYTHYHPYNTPEEKNRQLKLKKEMGERLTDLFENTSQMFKKREKLKHEENEVFFTQREKVWYTYYWYVSENLPQNTTFEDLVAILKKSVNGKMKIGNIEYKLHQDGIITGIRRRNGMKHRYFWNFKDTTAKGESYKDLEKKLQDEIKKAEEKYEKDIERGKWVSPAPEDSVSLGNKKCSFIGQKGIKQEWNQFDRDPNYYAAMSDAEQGLSDVGLLYFLCLFLDKSVAFELMEEVGFTEQCTFTRENAGENIDILLELMCLNRIRMVKSKLDSEMTETALALDMLNEVRKCPKQLYEVFSKEAREKFKDDATVEWEMCHNQEAVHTEEQETEREDDETPIEFESVEADDDAAQSAFKDTPRSTLVRWQDRFPQMALRYIDARGLFEDIRFQLNLGKYRFAFYTHDKEDSIDGEERFRILQKELHGFGRIQEVEVELQNLWHSFFEKRYEKDGISQKLPDVNGQAPYVTKQKPQYAIDEKSHSIGLRWEGWDNGCRTTGNAELIKQHFGNTEEKICGLDRKKMFIPYLPVDPVTPKDAPHQTNQAEKLLPPQAMMSLFELPGLLFYQYLLEKNGKDSHLAEQVIMDVYNNLKAFFTDVSEGKLLPLNPEDGLDLKEELGRTLQERYKLRLSDIPEKLRKYLLSVCLDYEKKLRDSAYNRLKERKERVERTLESYREKRKRIGTGDNKFDKMHATIKTGALAQSLMRDIMDWLPLNSAGRTNLTGQNYMALQADIALLGQEFIDEDEDKKEMTLTILKAALVKGKIIDEKNEGIDQKRFHPFLHLVFRDCEIDSVERFYELYLEKEINRINKVVEFLDGAKGNYSKLHERYRFIPFLHHERERWAEPNAQSMQRLAARYLERPIQLPNGLFTQVVYSLLVDLSQQKEWTQFRKKLQEANQGDISHRLSNNVSYLINLYFNDVEHDQSQPFYLTEPIDGTPSRYRHIYRVFKKFFGTPINKKKTPAYTIEELRGHMKDKETISAKINEYVGEEVEKYRKDKERAFFRGLRKYEDKQWKELKAEKLPSGKHKWTIPQIKEEVARRVQKEKDELKRSIECYRERLTKKQERMFRKVEDNERAIRRFKTQDILLLMMARQILKAKSKDRDFESGFCLKDVMSDSLLNKPIDFEWDVYVRDKEQTKIRKTIRQEGMKMKDYGQFYKFLSDKKRLATLLSRLPQTSFLRAEIENEFSYYDTNRSEVFRLVYEIEYEAYQLWPMLEKDENAEPKNAGNGFYYKDHRTGKLVPKRNNFLSLLEILAAGEDGVLDEVEKRIMQSIRNSISHNTYEVEMDAIFEGKKAKMKLPEVANGIKEKMNTATDVLKERINQQAP